MRNEQLTPLNQYEHLGNPNRCPWCDFWHPVASIVGDHKAVAHPGLVKEES